VHGQRGLAHTRRPVDGRDHDRLRRLRAGTVQQPGQRGQLTGPARELRHGSRQLSGRDRLRATRRQRGGPGRGQRGIVGQYPLVQLAQLGAGLGTELLDQHAAGALVILERLRLPSAADEGQHELGVKALPQPMLRGQRLQLRHQLGVAAEVQPGVRLPFHGLQPQLLQPRPLSAAQQLRRDVRQRIAPPQPERLAERRSGLLPVVGPHRGGALAAKTGEAQQVHLFLACLNQVAGETGHHPRSGVRAEDPA
jgi:hypothetical protein